MNLRQNRVDGTANFSVLDEIYAVREPAPSRRTPADYRAQVFILSLAGLTLAAGGLAFAQFKHDLTRPRAQLLAAATQAGGSPLTDVPAPVATDTDGDGLTDDEEVNVYATSRYLEDTDSDGVSDAEEVRAKTNPTCAQGRVCELLPTAVDSAADAAPAAAPPAPADQGGLRARLAGMGVSPDILESLDDEDLSRIFQSVLATAPAPGAAAPDPVSGQGLPTAPVNREAAPTDLRAWLTQQGVPADLLEQVSDAELRPLLDESLKPATP